MTTTAVKVCSVEGCGRDTSKGGHGLCGMHYARKRRGKPLGGAGYLRDPRRPVADRVYSRLAVNPETGCWEWQSSATREGYGVVGIGQELVLVHRWVYEHMIAAIPDGLIIDHLCCNRLCANPYHLEPVTRAENNSRGGFNTQGTRSWDFITHCTNGHLFDDANTYIAPNLQRRCRTCARDYQARKRAEKRAAA